jgi:hypothetical protein
LRKRSAIAAPIPEPAPVINAVFKVRGYWHGEREEYKDYKEWS